MMNYQKLLKISFILFSISFVSCEEEIKDKEVIVAQVGSSKLTENELTNILGSKKYSQKYREEFIKNWIETEILYEMAIEGKLLNSENYYRIIKDSEKELASSIALDKLLFEHPIQFSDSDLVEFYNSKKEDYVFTSDAFILNVISFKNEESAINFRNFAVETNWSEALKKYGDDQELNENYSNKIYRSSQIHSQKLLRLLAELFQDDISIVVENEPNDYVVVQMIDKIDQSAIPQFDYVKDRVKESFILNKQKEILSHLLDSLKLEKKAKVF